MEFIVGVAAGALAGGLLMYVASSSLCRQLERENAELKAALQEVSYRAAFAEPKPKRTMWD